MVKSQQNILMFDRWLIFAAVCLILIGLLMVASSSIVISEKQYHYSFHYLTRQTLFLMLGLCSGFAILRIETATWEKASNALLLFSFILLILVLVPGIGHAVNGSMRWLGSGPFRLQVSELVKLFIIVYLASYLVRHSQHVKHDFIGFLKPLFLIGLITLLLLKEPDFGAAVVILLTSLGMLYLAGVRLWQFAIILIIAAVAIGMLAISSPYRLVRLTTFLNPWANQFDSGYQLTQSLIAFGRGGWFGVGLGESIQKLFYLPEAHTDFLFAVLAEELGLLGVLLVISLFTLLMWRILAVGRRALKANLPFCAYISYGCALWIGIQALVNIGVNSGLLPTKGLTLPLMSYGGSSMLINCVVLALLLRIDFETRSQHYGIRK